MQGRAVGVCVVAALQDPRKEVLAFRDLFPAKIALRLDEPVQVDMVLGDGAREQGARCDRIADTLQGVGYVRVDGVREPIRVRAAYVTDEDIATTATDYGGPRTLDGEALFQAAECDVPDEVVELDASHDHAAETGGDRNAS
jgi:S-DNA-T family DNA segregation ATPase FtsK/SpoIIIE